MRKEEFPITLFLQRKGKLKDSKTLFFSGGGAVNYLLFADVLELNPREKRGMHAFSPACNAVECDTSGYKA